jgi:gliding motility-associated-like protein
MKQIYIAILLLLVCQLGIAGEKNILLPPSATIAGNATVCQNATSPVITFTGSGGTAPYTFTYTVTGVTGNQTIVTTSGNSVTVAAPTGTVGVFIYSLISVKDNTNTTQNQTGTVTITVGAAPTVDFSFNNDNTCSGTTVQFTSSVIGTGPYSYSWNFGDATALSTQANPTHAFTSLGCGTATFNVMLTVTVGGCTVIRSHTVTVKQKPDISFSDINNPGDPFSNCSGASTNPVFSITVANNSASSCVTSYSINWDTANPTIENNISFPISHTYYQLGVYTMTITAIGINGCSNIVSYQIKNVSSPGGGLSIPNNIQNLCAPTPNIDIAITNWGTNSLDTTYSFSYGDTPPTTIVLTQSQLVNSSYYVSSNPASSPAYPIPHSFASTSCPTYYTITLNIANACNANPPQTATIYVITKPTANFTAPVKACLNTNVLFTNTTTPGYGNNCSSGLTLYTWDFGDPSSGTSNTINTGYVSTIPNANHTFSGIGLYNVTMTAQNQACGSSIKQQEICIESPLVPQFALGTIEGCTPLNVTTANNTSLGACSSPTYQWNVTYASGFCGSTPAVWSYLNGTATSASPTFSFVTPGTYSISVTMTNSCGAVTSPVQTVVVKKPPTVSIASISDSCGTATINPTATINSCAPATSTLTYAWSFPGGIPATSNSANPGIINYATIGNYTVSLIVTNECGASSTATQSFSVNTAPIITNTSLSQTICSGSQTTLVTLTANPSPPTTTFSWTATATAGISGFTTSGTNTIPIQTITTTNTVAGTVTYTIIPTVGTCVGATVIYVVTVNPAPTNTTPLVSSTVCVGGTPTVLSVLLNNTSGNPTYQWYTNSNTSGAGGTLISGATNATFSPPATTPGTFYYYCVVSLTTGGCSSITSNTATVIINALPTISTQPIATQNLCVGATISSALTVSPSGGTGTLTYQWYSNTTNSTIGATPVGTNSANYTPPVFSTVGTFYFYVEVSLNGSGCGTVTSSFAEITVVADPVVSVQPLATQTQCENATATLLTVTATGGIGTYTYEWYSTTNPTNSGGTPVGTNSPNYLPPTNTVGTFYYYCSVTQSGLGCSIKSDVATVVVVTAPQITTQPQSISVCQGVSLAPLTVGFANGTGTATYQWYDDNGPISGALTNTYNPTNTVTGNYYCIITFSSGGCTSITSSTATITINPAPTVTVQPLAIQNICVGGTISLPLTIATAGGTGTVSYQWYSNTTNTTVGGTAISGANAATYSPPALIIAQSYYYYVEITFGGGGCGFITSSIAQVDVVNDPTVTSQPLPIQTVCQSASATVLSVVAFGGIGTNYSYQWYSNLSNTTTTGTLITGETNATYTPPTAISGTFYYYCVITQVNGIGCNVTSAIAMVTVSLAPAFTTTLASSTICLGQIPSPLLVVTNSDALLPNYQWFSNPINSNSGGTLISGAINATYNPPATTAGTTYYYCEVTFPSITGGCSVIITNTAEVIINLNPVIASETTVICSNTAFVVTPTTVSGNIIPIGTTYTWTTPTINPAGAITGATAQTTPQNTISQTLVNTTTNPAIVTYTVTPTSGICVGTNFTVTVTVNPAINPNVVAINNTCFGVSSASSITTAITGGIPPYTITWTYPNGTTSNATAISNLVPGVYNLLVNDMGNCPFTNSYTITEPNDIVITTDVNNNITCFGQANGAIAISVSGGTGAYTYTWTKNTIPYASTEDISNLGPGTYIVSVTDANNCGPKTAIFTITEPPILAVNLVSQTNVDCYGFATGEIVINVTGGTPIQISPSVFDYTYSWSGPNAYSSTNQNINNLIAGIYNLTVTDNLGCIKNLSVTITQSSEIIINATTTLIECYGDDDATIAVTISGGNPPYQFQWSNLASSLNQNNLSPGDYIITVTDNLTCQKTLSINIPSPPVFAVNPVVTNISCFGENDGSIILNFVGGIAPVNLVWSDGSTAGTTRNNLGPGTYSVTITDSKPCTIFRTFTIIEPQPIVLSANLTNALDCNNPNTGAINLIVSGGTPPFTYSWSNGSTTEDLNAISSGNFLVTVTDVNGCVETAQYIIVRPAPILITVATQTDFDCQTHEVNQNFVAQVSGGIPPYQLDWSSGTISGANNEIMHTNVNGAVLLTVTDSYGCIATYTVEVATPILGYTSFDTSSFGYITYGIYSIGDPIQFQSTVTGDYESIIWDFGDGTFSTELNPIHTYLIPKDYVVTQTVTYPFGCVYEQTITLLIEKGYVLVVPTAFTPNDDSLNDTFRPVTKALKNVHLDVYDTWGSIIYSEVGDVLRGWDAKIKGFNAENGNYYSKVSAETFYGTIVNSNQTFVLIR